MAISRIRFVEQNVGLAPIRTNVKNRILIIDEFNRGAANRADYITGFSYAAQNYGIDTTSGSLNYQIANDQLTSDLANFGFLRVLGRGVHATSSSILFTGTALKENTLNLTLTAIQDALVSFPFLTPDSPITPSGTYTGANPGRYYFKVNAIAADVATILYQFVEFDVLQSDLNWTGADSISVDLGTDKAAVKVVENGISIAFGLTSQTDDIDLTVGLIFSVRVDAVLVEVPINAGDIPEFVAAALVEALSGTEPVGQVELNSEADGLVFKLNEVGTAGNLYSFHITLTDTVSPGISFTPTVATKLTNGVDGPAKASLVFYANDETKTPLFQLIAKSEGTWGNLIKVTLVPRSGGKFTLNISDAAANSFNPPLQAETFDLDFLDLDSGGVLNQLASSNYVDGIFLPKLNEVRFGISYAASLLKTAPQRISLTGNNFGAGYLKDLFLDGGTSPIPDENDYVAALIEAEKFPSNIILCANPKTVAYTALRTEIVAHCEKITEQEGLRIALLPAKKGLTPQQAKTVRNGLDSSRLVMPVGWVTYAGQPNAPRFSVSAAAAYAGVIAALPFFYSPSAGNLRAVQGIVECDTARFSDYGSLKLFDAAKLEVLTLEPIQQKYQFNTGNLATSDTNWIGVYTRRAYDEIRSEIYARMLKYQGQPHNGFLRAKITSDISLYMNRLVRMGEILSFSGVTINADNNDLFSYRAGQLYIAVGFQELVSATDIVITLYRDDSNGTTNFNN